MKQIWTGCDTEIRAAKTNAVQKTKGETMREMKTTKALILLLCILPFSVSADIVWSGTMDRQLDFAPRIFTPGDPFPQPAEYIFELDLNGDGSTDFLLNHYSGLEITPVNNAALANNGDVLFMDVPWASIPATTVDGSLSWGIDMERLVYFSHSDAYGEHYHGSWVVASKGVLGLSLEVDGQTHYGWLRMSSNYRESFIVHDFAYESTPNTAIVAGAIPEPSTLALLLAGAGGIWTVREKRFRSRENLPWG